MKTKNLPRLPDAGARALCGQRSRRLPAYASELSDDLSARRARVMEALGPDAMLILWSAPSRTYSLDVSYEYRQDSNLYYLTGITQADTILVLMPGQRLTERDPVRAGSRPVPRALERPHPQHGRSSARSGNPHGAVASRSSTRLPPPCSAARHLVSSTKPSPRRLPSALAAGPRQGRPCCSTPDRRANAWAPARTSRARPRSFCRLPGGRRHADHHGAQAREDRLRAEEPGQEPAVSSDAQMAGMRARQARRLGVPGRGGHRKCLHGPRGDGVELPVDCRQRTERHDPALHREHAPDAGWRPAARRRRRATTSSCTATSRAPIRSAGRSRARSGRSIRSSSRPRRKGIKVASAPEARCSTSTARPPTCSRPAC